MQHVTGQEHRHDTGARPEMKIVADRATSLCQPLETAMGHAALNRECYVSQLAASSFIF